jgi:hypothetical protein
MQKLGMKPVPGVSRVTIKKSKNVSCARWGRAAPMWTDGRWTRAAAGPRCRDHAGRRLKEAVARWGTRWGLRWAGSVELC